MGKIVTTMKSILELLTRSCFYDILVNMLSNYSHMTTTSADTAVEAVVSGWSKNSLIEYQSRK